MKRSFVGLILLFLLVGCFDTSRQEAFNLSADQVPEWLEKNQIEVPEFMEEGEGLNKLVIDVILDAKEGVDTGLPISASITRDFIRDVQEAAGYQFNH